jgi:hypothetical protein
VPVRVFRGLHIFVVQQYKKFIDQQQAEAKQAHDERQERETFTPTPHYYIVTGIVDSEELMFINICSSERCPPIQVTHPTKDVLSHLSFAQLKDSGGKEAPPNEPAHNCVVPLRFALLC